MKSNGKMTNWISNQINNNEQYNQVVIVCTALTHCWCLVYFIQLITPSLSSVDDFNKSCVLIFHSIKCMHFEPKHSLIGRYLSPCAHNQNCSTPVLAILLHLSPAPPANIHLYYFSNYDSITFRAVFVYK